MARFKRALKNLFGGLFFFSVLLLILFLLAATGWNALDYFYLGAEASRLDAICFLFWKALLWVTAFGVGAFIIFRLIRTFARLKLKKCREEEN